jgi:hypothetical protein
MMELPKRHVTSLYGQSRLELEHESQISRGLRAACNTPDLGESGFGWHVGWAEKNRALPVHASSCYYDRRGQGAEDVGSYLPLSLI